MKPTHWILGAIGVISTVAAVANFTSEPQLDRAKAKAKIASLLQEHGLEGYGGCPKSEFVVGEPIACNARLSDGRALKVVVVPTNSTDANFYINEIFVKANAEAYIRDGLGRRDLKTITCPKTHALFAGEEASCSIEFADGSKDTIRIRRHPDGRALMVENDVARVQLARSRSET